MASIQLLFLSVLTVLLVPSTEPCSLMLLSRGRMTLLQQWLGRADPSPLRNGPDSFAANGGITNLQVEIRNHGMEGYSRGDHSIKGGSVSVYNETKTGVITTAFFMIGNITFSGEYSAFGIIHSQPVSVQGRWHISVPRTLMSLVTLSFATSPEGFLYLTSHYLYDLSVTDMTGMSVYFQNLSDHQAAIGHEEEISETLVDGFQRYLREDNSDHPFRQLFLQFWNEFLAETKFEDINH